MKRAKFDVETNGLLGSVTKAHVLCVKVGNEKRKWTGDDIPKGLKFLDTCDQIVAHNAIGFDLMALWMLYRWVPKAEVVDTLTLSCLVHPDIFGGHSLDEWGKRLGEPKLDYKQAYIDWRKADDAAYKYSDGDEWVECNPVMEDYCEQDVEVLDKLDRALQADMKGWDWSAAAKMEHQFAKDFARQAWRGVYIDKPHTEKLLADIEAQMSSIESTVEPLLPTREGTKGELKSARPPKLCFKKDGQPTAATTNWFDKLEQTDNGGWQGYKFGQWHRLPTPMEEDGTERKPLITQFPMTLKDQADLKSWLMRGGPTKAAIEHYDKVEWRD